MTNATEYLIRYGNAGTQFRDTERKARNAIKKLLADQSWRRGFGGNTDIGLYELDESGTPHIVDAIDVPEDRRFEGGQRVNRLHRRALDQR